MYTIIMYVNDFFIRWLSIHRELKVALPV